MSLYLSASRSEEEEEEAPRPGEVPEWKRKIVEDLVGAPAPKSSAKSLFELGVLNSDRFESTIPSREADSEPVQSESQTIAASAVSGRPDAVAAAES